MVMYHTMEKTLKEVLTKLSGSNQIDNDKCLSTKNTASDFAQISQLTGEVLNDRVHKTGWGSCTGSC